MPPEPRRRHVGIAKHNNRLLSVVGGQPWAPDMNTPSRSYNPAVDSPDIFEQAESFSLKPATFDAPKPTASADGRRNRERSQQRGMMDEDELGRPDAPAVTEGAGRSSRSVSRGLDDVVPSAEREFSASMMMGAIFGGQSVQQAAKTATTRIANTGHNAKWVRDAEKGANRTKRAANTYKSTVPRRTRENTMSSQPQELEMKTVTKKCAPTVTKKAPVNIESENESGSTASSRKRKEQSPPQVRGKKPQYNRAQRGSGALGTKTGVGKPVSAKSTASGRNGKFTPSDDEEIKGLKNALPVPTKKKFVPPPGLGEDRDSSEDSQDEHDRKTKAELAAKRKPAKQGFKNPLVTNPVPVNKKLLEELGISSSQESKVRVFKNPLAGYSIPERKDSSSGITAREALALARKSDDSSPGHYSDPDMDLTGYGVTKADIIAQNYRSRSDPKTDICKICSTPLPPHFLAPYRTANQRHILMDVWIKICEDHQALSLRTEWESRNYPTISWANLPDRCTALLPTITKIISNDISSEFRRTFEQQAKATNTTAVKALRSGQEFTHAGYYGPRGLSIMLHAIVKGLIEPLKAASATDPAIARTGEMAFAQDVLVPELALRLIVEDMDVGEKKAAQILRESKDIGMKLNGEESTDDLYVGDTSGWLDVHATQNAKGAASAMSLCSSSEGSGDEGDFFAKQKAELEAKEKAREKVEKAARIKEKVKGKMKPRRVSLTSSSSEEEKGSWER